MSTWWNERRMDSAWADTKPAGEPEERREDRSHERTVRAITVLMTIALVLSIAAAALPLIAEALQKIFA